MKRIMGLTAVVVMSLAASGVLLAQENPFLGTWKLNVAKSKYSGVHSPNSETRTAVAQAPAKQSPTRGLLQAVARFRTVSQATLMARMHRFLPHTHLDQIPWPSSV